MKVAICFSGLTRSFADCFDQINEFIIKPNNADIFIHTWKDNSVVGSILQEQIPNFAKPIDIVIEDQIKFSEDPYNSRKRDIPVFNTLSYTYSMMKANNLKTKYELKNNFVYDWVIRCRMDLLPYNRLFLEKIPRENGKIYMPDQWLKWRNHRSVEDQFAFGTSEAMDIFCDFFNHLEDLWTNTDIHFNAEDMLTLYLLGEKEYRGERKLSGIIKYGEKKADIEIVDMNYEIIR